MQSDQNCEILCSLNIPISQEFKTDYFVGCTVVSNILQVHVVIGQTWLQIIDTNRDRLDVFVTNISVSEDF